MKWVAGALLALSLVALAVPAAAEDKEAAQKLLNEGNALVADGDYVAALERFRSAYAAFSSPKILLNIGTTLRGLGRNAEAAETYARYLEHPQRDTARAADVERILRDIKRIVTTLHVRANEPGAQITVDGKPLKAPGAALLVDPGEHTIIGEKAGLTTAVRRVVTRPGEDVSVGLLLLPPAVRVVVTPASKAQRNAAFVAAGLGLGGVGVGVAYGLLARGADADAEAHCVTAATCDAAGAALGATAKRDATASTVALSVGAGLVAAGVVLYLTAPSRRDAQAPAAAFSVGPRGASVVGTF